GYKVNVGYSKGYEVDFVATKKNEKVYIQVTYLLSSEKTIQREFSNLANIKDNYPKYVVSMDKFPVTSDYPGIIQIFMLDFLMKEKLSN
ncbi:MAG: ATP-binding protein, partial [Bacteroidales bacterium]|nr:ATP-binding protein [Bacteroidales bacterium]